MGTRSAEIGRGLAQVEAGVGTLVSFSTQPGNVALDGTGRNSPFAGALVKHFGAPKDDLSNILIAVRNDVMKETQRKQVPWEHSALTGRFYFSRAQTGPSPPSATATPPSHPSATATPAAAATIRPAGRFDGIWQITRLGEDCRNPNFEFRLVITNDRVEGKLGPEEIKGTITETGAIKFGHKNTQKSGPPLRYAGKLVGGNGTGTFATEWGACRGTFTATLP